MAQRTRWKQQPTETTLAALGDARIQNITFYNTRQLMLHRYFRNEHNPPAHVFLSASSAMLSAVVILQSGRIRKFFDLDGGADVVLSRHVLGVVRSLALSDALPASTSLNALFRYPAPELRSLEITMNASDAAPAHSRLVAYRGPGWAVCPKLWRLRLRAPQTREVSAAEVNAFMLAICGRTIELQCVNVVLV